jgi:nitric oxide reductase activation protein
MWAKNNLLARRENRKLMLVITDGQPNSKSLYDAGASKFALDAIKMSQKSGIEMFGIGIDLDSIADFFEHHIVIRDIASLPQQLFKMLQKNI